MDPHGGLRRPDPHDRQAGDRRGPPRGRAHDPRPRLPGLRHAAGAGGQGSRHRRPTGRHLHELRRHAARPRLHHGPARPQGPWRRRAHRLQPARRPQDRPGEPGATGRVLRRRLRDHRARERDVGRRGRPPGHRQLQRPGLSRARAAGDDGAAGLAEQPGPGVPGCGPRVRDHGLDRVRAHRREVPRPDRRDGLRAPRPPRRDLDGHPPAGGGPVRGGEPVHSRRDPRGRPARPAPGPERVRDRQPQVARRGRDPDVRLPPAPGVRPVRRRAEVRRRRHRHQRAPGLHRGRHPDRREDAARLHRLWDPVQPAEAPGRADGQLRGHLRRLLLRGARAERRRRLLQRAAARAGGARERPGGPR